MERRNSHAYKRGPWDQAASYRAIMLLPSLAKRFHAFLRLQLCQQIAPHRPEGVLGGFPHQEVHFGAQYLRTRNAIAESQHRSFGVLFIDIKNAFHNVIREQLTGVHDENLFARLLDRINMAEDVKAVLRLQESEGILHGLGVSEWLIGLLAEVHQDTWYTMRHDGGLHKTGRGTRPGSPIADLCFHVLMIDMMKEVENNSRTTFGSPPLRQSTVNSSMWSGQMMWPYPVKRNFLSISPLLSNVLHNWLGTPLGKEDLH